MADGINGASCNEYRPSSDTQSVKGGDDMPATNPRVEESKRVINRSGKSPATDDKVVDRLREIYRTK